MSWGRSFARALAAGATVAVIACSGTDATLDSSKCIAGDAKACPCSGTAMGVQVCADDGSHYTPCSCDDGGASATDGSSADGTIAQDAAGLTSDGSGLISDGAGSVDAPATTDAGADATTDGAADASSDGAIADASSDSPIADARADGSVDGCAPSGPEECFNGVDDDCDGLTDCADPACQPVAECVPEAAGFTYGAEVAPGGACPADFGAATLDLSQGLTAPTTCNGCACTASLTCTNLLTEGAAGTCPPFSPVVGIDVNSLACESIHLTSHNASTQSTSTHTSCGWSGTPSPAALSWGAGTRVCTTSSVGAGCAPGNVCVAKATKHCATTSASAACAAGYHTEGAGGPWYTGVTDTRSCGSTCGCTTSGGSCGMSIVELFTASGCGAGSTTEILDNAVACNMPLTYQSVRVAPGHDAVQPTCSPSYAPMTGSASPSGAVTVCCL